MFKSISHIVKDQLERILWDEGGDDKYIFTREFNNDYASQDYVDKNIRIWPHSGKDQVEDQKVFKHDDLGVDEEENEFKVLKMEIEEQWEQVKKRKEEMDRKKRLEEEKKRKR